MTLHELADELIEIRRYVRNEPFYVERKIRDLHYSIFRLDDPAMFGHRLRDNLAVGLVCILHNPEVLEGYLYGAAAEIRALALRKEEER